MKKIIRIIEAKQVTNYSETDLQFYCESAGIIGTTLVSIKYEHPQFFSSIDLYPFYSNYFLGEIGIKWHHKFQKKLTGDNEFTLYLPENADNEKLWNLALANQSGIERWVSLWYEYENTRYSSHLGIPECTYEKYHEQKKVADELWQKLKETGLVIGDDMLVRPQYLFILSCEMNSHYYSESEKFDVEWITPNALITNKKENFYALMKSAKGIRD